MTQQERPRLKQRDAKKLEPTPTHNAFSRQAAAKECGMAFLLTNSGGGVKSQEHSQVRLSFPPKGEAPNGDGAAPA